MVRCWLAHRCSVCENNPRRHTHTHTHTLNTTPTMAANGSQGSQKSHELIEANLVCCLMLYMFDPTNDAFNAAVTQVLQLGTPSFNRPLLDAYLTLHATHINSHLPPQGNMNLPDTTSINEARDQFNALLRN